MMDYDELNKRYAELVVENYNLKEALSSTQHHREDLQLDFEVSKDKVGTLEVRIEDLKETIEELDGIRDELELETQRHATLKMSFSMMAKSYEETMDSYATVIDENKRLELLVGKAYEADAIEISKQDDEAPF